MENKQSIKATPFMVHGPYGDVMITVETIARRRQLERALTSGEYKQVTSVLHAGGNSFCFLGVATDLVKDEVKAKKLPTGGFKFKGGGGVVNNFPSHDVINLFGMNESEARTMMRKNDQGRDFSELAASFKLRTDELEAQLERAIGVDWVMG